MVNQPHMSQEGATEGHKWMTNPNSSKYNAMPAMTTSYSYSYSIQIIPQEVQKLKEEMQQMKNLQQKMKNLSSSSASAIGSLR